MRGRSLAAAALVTAIGFGPILPAQAAGTPAGVGAAALRAARQALAPTDGWAAAGTGTTGGSAADAAHTFVVRNRAGLVAALSGEAAPRIVFVNGRFSMRVNADDKPLGCADSADCYPAWDPTDGAAGNWNSLYDLVSLTGASNVWIDHNTFSDGNNHDADQPLHFGRPYQAHDGANDIIRGSDLVTVSYNNYYDHDKTMLIGSTDTPGVDVGKLRVTVHHNRFGNVIQRAPRVRFGQVDIFDNYYVATEESYGYSVGVGFESSIYAENNYFLRSEDLGDGDLIKYWKGTKITAIGTLTQVGHRRPQPADLVAAYNTAYDPDFSPDAGWVPTLRTRLDPTALVPAIVKAAAGSCKLGI